MLTQQLTVDLGKGTGVLSITATSEALVELQGLAEELSLRPTITTNGTIEMNLPAPPEAPPDPI